MKRFLKIISYLLSITMIFSFIACGNEGVKPDDKKEQECDKYVELLHDPNFNRGFNMYGPDSRFHSVNQWEQFLADEESLQDPVWKLGTWGCFVNYFLDRNLSVTEDGKTYNYTKKALNKTTNGDLITISNPTYTVGVNAKTGYVSLYIDAREEYGVVPSYTDTARLSKVRKSGEAWPHLLIQENIGNPTSVGEMSELFFSLDFIVNNVENHMNPSDYNTSTHTAQITWFVSVACVNPSSAFYNKYIWFGLPIYDYRNGFPTRTETAYFDGGKEDSTGMLIYNTPSCLYLNEEFEQGKRYAFSVDMYSQVQNAFSIAQKKGMFTDCDLNDMQIINTNLGWEIPGTFSALFEMFDLSIKFAKAK